MKKITFTQNEDGITINIPQDFLQFVAENNEENPVMVVDLPQFQEDVAFALENYFGKKGSQLTGFQELLDEAIDGVAELGSSAYYI